MMLSSNESVQARPARDESKRRTCQELKRRTSPASNECGTGTPVAAIDHGKDDLLNRQSTNNGGRRRR